MRMEQIIKTKYIASDLDKAVKNLKPDFVFVLMDQNTFDHCLPLLNESQTLSSAQHIVIPSDDIHKTSDSLLSVWQTLSEKGATRHSVLINLGGGMVTDMGGLAAATFKRGIHYINIPTTLLGAVDASVGGKTAINFNGLKNEIGAFYPAKYVLISSDFFATLSQQEIMSGYAEMIKHALISSHKDWEGLLNLQQMDFQSSEMLENIYRSVSIKQHIVEKDPFEKDVRKALNLGHTIGHAFESLAFVRNRPVSHGFAVAYGLISELYLSHRLCDFPKEKLQKTVRFIHDNYGSWDITCDDYEALYAYMKHDKKNMGDAICFTLLSDIGNVKINQTADKKLILESLDFYRDSVGL